MKKDKNLPPEPSYTNARFAVYPEDEEFIEEEDQVYGSRADYIAARLQGYFEASRAMLAASVSHLRQPSTIIVIILLIGTYILLGVAGQIQFSFFTNKVVQYVQTNLDITVNALLGFFYGPVTCAISVALCTTVRMITNRTVFFIGYILGALIAGFLHGWILYRFKNTWFETRFRGFYTGLLARVIGVRLVVSSVVNIFLMSLIYRIFIHYPFLEFVKNYSKSGVPLSSPAEFFSVFFVSIGVESAIVFAAICIINFIAAKAFPSRFEQPSLIVGRDGSVLNPDEEDFDE